MHVNALNRLTVRVSSEQKPNTAAEYVAAHLSKIHGLDWHPDSEFIFATSSQDNSVRVRAEKTQRPQISMRNTRETADSHPVARTSQLEKQNSELRLSV